MKERISTGCEVHGQVRFQTRGRFAERDHDARAGVVELLRRDYDDASYLHHFGMYEARLKIADQNHTWAWVKVYRHAPTLQVRGAVRKAIQLM